MAGFNFGGSSTTTTTQASTGFSFGLAKTTASTLLTNPAATTTVPAASGFSFGLNKTTAAATPSLFGAPAAATATAPTAGFGGFGTTPAAATTASTGFSLTGLGATPAAGTTGISFGKPAATSVAPLPGFGGTGLLGSAPAATTASTGLGGLGGGLFGTTAAASGAGTSIFNSLPTSSAATGLGGVDPNTAAKQGGGDGAAASDGKTLKESFLPEPLVATVDSLQKFVKDEKVVREDIARMSSKPMGKVQEEVTALRQLLSVVATGLQRNMCSVGKLKVEMTMNLKNAEMAQRTKDIPPGLQYENTAPSGYFQHLVEEFESRMATYRQQMDTLDSHLAALHSNPSHSPAEMLALLKKQHDTLISLAAQLQGVHEAVKSQKEQYLTYRRVFHGDAKNVFSRPHVAPKVARRTELADLAGPNPFPSTRNAATRAMSLVQNLSHQPQGPPVTGLVTSNTSAFGASAFGGGIFNSPKPSTGLTLPSTTSSLGGVGSLFSSTGGLGPTPTPPTLGASTTAALNLAGTTNLNMSANGKQPFQLQKPPVGNNKRGKR